MSRDEQDDGLAHRIEETLIAREKERREILAAHSKDTVLVPAKKSRKGLSFALLTLGFVLGGLIGALCYMLLPAPQATASSAPSPAVSASNLLVEADRLLVAGQNDAARSTYLTALRQNPDSVQAYNNLAVLYAAEGNLPQAREQLDRALNTSPAYQAVHENIARVYAGMARNSYGKALQLREEAAPVQLKPLGLAAKVASPLPEKISGEHLPAARSSMPLLATNTPSVTVEPVKAPTPALDLPPSDVPSAVEFGPDAEAQTEGVVAVNSDDLTLLAKLEDDDIRPATPVSDPAACVTPQQFLDLWADAWSSQNVKKYLAFYAPGYFSSPPGSRAKWEAQRRQRLSKPSFIQVELMDFLVTVQTDQRAEVKIVQSYQSDNYRDKTRKLMVLERKDSSWQITDERTLERLN